MKAVILAAGKSTRTFPLTVTRPKPLLTVANRTLLEHNLSQLSGLVDEVIIVIGHEGRQIPEKLSRFDGIRITYVEQKEQLGTAHAILAVEKIAGERFIILMGDDLYSRADIERCLKHDNCLLAKDVEDISRFGAVIMKDRRLLDLIEKSATAPTKLANTGLYVLGKAIFPRIKALEKSSRGEYEITDAIRALANEMPVAVETATFWHPITYPWSLLAANEALLTSVDGEILGTVEEGATIKGKAVVGKNTLIRAGSYIEGPVIIGSDCDIGPNCYIRAATSIGNNCRIGNAVEIKNSIIMSNTHIGHLSYVGDSVVGENVNIAAGFIVANLRHDDTNVKSQANGGIVDTGRRKFGTVLGDFVKTGIHTSVYPGRKIWPNKTTLPGEIVRKDVA